MAFLKVASVEDMKRVAEAYVKNTTLNDGVKDPFWTSAADVLVQACVGLLTEKPENGDITYAKIDDVIGGKDAPHYEACFGNIDYLLRLAAVTYDPMNSPIQMMDGAQVKKDASDLDVIFENLRVYEAKRQNCNVEDMKKPYCLEQWDTFHVGPQKTCTNILKAVAPVKLVWTPAKAIKVPQIVAFTDDKFNFEDYTHDNDEAKKKAIESYKSEAAKWE